MNGEGVDVIVALTSSDILLSCEKNCLDSNNLPSVEKLSSLNGFALTSSLTLFFVLCSESDSML